MFEKYYKLYKKCAKIKKPTYSKLIKIKKEWDKLTLELFDGFDIKDIVEMWTLLDNTLCDKEYFSNFTASLEAYSDRMNLNRWCRLHLLLGNALDAAYCELER